MDTTIATTYDALNRRIQKTISNGGLTGDVTNGTVNYLHDGQQVVMSRDAMIAPATSSTSGICMPKAAAISTSRTTTTVVQQWDTIQPTD
jgi:hypothetical protein